MGGIRVVCAASLYALILATGASAQQLSSPIRPFPLKDVQLAGSSFQAKAAASNAAYLLDSLDADRLLWNFRKNAGLQAPGLPYGGSWEDPGCELRGHFTGHYLSALALVVHSTGMPRAVERLNFMVAELGKVQLALGEGYLSAFPTEHFDRLESLKGVWAPYYVIHKIMLGLVDAHELAGSAQALKIASAMGNYFHARTQKVIREKGKEHWVKTLEFEFGGMNEVLYRLYRLTKKDAHRDLAALFDKPRWWEALTHGMDPLAFHHANTHLAQVVGFAERYNTVGDKDALLAVTSFFQIITANYSFATGGSNSKEFWQTARMMSEAVLMPEHSLETHEICTQYNILKIVRQLFMWTGDVRYADFYERALVNGILGVSRLTNDEVLDQEEDNLELLQRLLHRHHGHDHGHDHLHELADAHDSHGPASAVGSAAAGPAHSNQEADHLQELADLLGKQHKEQMEAREQHSQRRLLATGSLEHGLSHISQSASGLGSSPPGETPLGWVNAGGGSSRLQGSIDSSAVGKDHLFRAAAAVRHDSHGLEAFSLGQEVSLLAQPQGELLPAAAPVGLAGPVLGPWTREFNTKFQDYWSFNFRHQANRTGVVNQPGVPGSFLYLLPMGVAQSKRDNHHHWGYPLHSFWCCYGTAVESFAKLADSIYFEQEGSGFARDAGILDDSLAKLYVNQYVSSSLAWHAAGLSIATNASMYAPGPGMQATLRVSKLQTAEKRGTPIPTAGLGFTLALRVPVWVEPQAGNDGGAKMSAVITVNGKPWMSQKGAATGGQYILITRRWLPGDEVVVRMRYRYWLHQLPDVRSEFQDLKAIMMGPFVMAGMTHDSHTLQLDNGPLPEGIVEPPAKADELISIQASWNSSLFLRADRYHAFTSVITDGGDAMDGTFIIRMGCNPHALPASSPSSGAAAAPQQSRRRLLEVAGSGAGQAVGLRQQLASQGVQEGDVISVEAMGMPGFFLGLQLADNSLVWDQWQAGSAAAPPPAQAVSLGGGADGNAALLGEVQSEHSLPGFCSRNTWRVKRALDGSTGSIALESVAKPGLFVTAARPSAAAAQKCIDHHPDCSSIARKGWCETAPETWLANCRLSCHVCRWLPAALVVRNNAELQADTDSKRLASWRFAAPLTHRYPPGAKVVEGTNRRYLLAPLGNLVDERYTVYWRLKTQSPTGTA